MRSDPKGEATQLSGFVARSLTERFVFGGDIIEAVTAYEQFWPWRLRRRNQPLPPNLPTAQEAYKLMIDQVISPALRLEGLRGSGGRYELPSPTHWALIGFQKSAYSDKSEIRFTINLTAVSREVWEHGRELKPYWGKRPSAGTHYGADVPTERIGKAAGREDTWWSIHPGEDSGPVSAEVIADLRNFGLPWLRRHLAD